MDRTKMTMKRRGTRRERLWDRFHKVLYRASGGRVLGRFTDDQGDSPVLLLTTTGRKTGKERTHCLLYLSDGDRSVVVASNSGADRHPAWFLNLEENPAVTVQAGRARQAATARVADAEERKALWPRLVEMYSGYDAYQADTDREIPVVVLEPVSG